MARIPLQCDFFAPVFEKARDEDKPRSQAEAKHLIDARAPMVPSKAHIKRNERAKAETFYEKARAYEAPSEQTLQTRHQLAFLKQVIADVGGSRTIAPSESGTVYYNARERGVLNYVEPVRTEQTAVSFAEAMAIEQERLDRERARLRAEADRENENNRIIREAKLRAGFEGMAAAMRAALRD